MDREADIDREAAIERWAKPLGIGVTAIVLCNAAAYFLLLVQADRPLSKVKMLQPGMSQSEVKLMLGQPTAVTPHEWHYSTLFFEPVVVVSFDENQRFTSSRISD